VDKLLSYLNKYLAEPKVMPSLPATDALLAELPEWWREVLLARGGDRVRQTLRAWEGYQEQLPTVFDFLSRHLRSVSLLTDRTLVAGTTSIRLLYELEKQGRTMYYAGGHPLRKSMSPAVQAAWPKLPADFRRFYDSLHNGWYYLASTSLGPSPTEDFFVLDDLEWGILEEIGDPGCNLKDLLAVYTNGMGAYVALTIERKGAYGDVLWWKDQRPELNIDAWAVMDAWTEIGLNT
jgi:hypothetical protein